MNLQVNLFLLLSFKHARLNRLEELQCFMDPLVEIFDSLLLVLKWCRINTSQAAESYFDSFSSVLELKDEWILVINEASLKERVGVDSLRFGVLLGLCDDVVESFQTFGEEWNDHIVEGGSRHSDGFSRNK
jgi:hypothetical protein